MLPSRWLRPLAAQLNRTPTQSTVRRPKLRLRVERLEDRTVPATITVTSTGDTISPDGSVTLREAITSINNGANVNADVVAAGTYGVNDAINFAIPASDPGHVYYRNDMVGGQLTTADVTHTGAADDATVGDIDPDYTHSWWSIQPSTQLPAITKPVVIDGYTQAGASPNTLQNDDNAILRIELNGRGPSPVNGGAGLAINGGNSTVRGLIINGFLNGNGIILQGAGGDRVQGNFIGIDASGTRAPYGLPNFSTFNTSTSDLANGLTLVESSGFQHDYIGTDSRTDPTDPPGWSDLAERNIISATGQGMHIIGSDFSDPSQYPAAQINNVIAGNFIGTDRHGTTALGNWGGLALLGGAHDDLIGTNGDGINDSGEGNVISGNEAGVILDSAGSVTVNAVGSYRSVLAGNSIGTDANGDPMGNMGAGVAVLQGALAVRIGGPSAVQGNTIAYNGASSSSLHYDFASNGTPYQHAPGVWIFTQVATPQGITVQGNSIFGDAGLGIDLGGSFPPLAADGVTPNDPGDADTGPNGLQNSPVITSVIVGPTTRVVGTLSSRPNSTYTLDFYASTATDFGTDQIAEGRRYLGSGTVTTDASGIGAFDSATFANVLGATNPGEGITATATDANGNTSEFSVNHSPIPNPGGPYTVAEGNSLTLDASGSSDPDGDTLTYSWDVNGDGIFGDATGVNPTLNWAQLVALGINDGPTMNPNVRVQVSDGVNPPVTSDPTSLTVTNTPPTAAITSISTPQVEGTAITATGSATDPSPTDTAAGLILSWQVFKNGSTTPFATGGNTGTFSFTPDDNGSYQVVLTATDKDGGVGTTEQPVVVQNLAPTVGITGPAAGAADQTLSFTLTAADPSPVDQSAGFTFQIDWDGNGTIDQTVTGTSRTTNTHPNPPTGPATIIVTATDKDGGSGTATTRLAIGNLSSITSNFNGTPSSAGRYVWFSSVLDIGGLSTSVPTTIWLLNQTISGIGSSPLAVPDASITFYPGTGTSATSFQNGAWHTDVYLGSGLSGNQFLSGLAYLVPAGGLPGGIQNITWSGLLFSDRSGVSLNWKWAAAVYTQLPQLPPGGAQSGVDYNAVGVKPVDDNKSSVYLNSDHAGTPEASKPYVTGGARGGGGSNYTGGYSGTLGVSPTFTPDEFLPPLGP